MPPFPSVLRRVPLLIVALVVGCAGPAPGHRQRSESRPDPRQTDLEPVEVAGLAFAPSAAWVSEPSESSSRVAQYSLPPAGADPDAASLVVYYFGPGAGSIDANMERWTGQFAQPDGRDSNDVARITGRDQGALHIDTIDVSGTYVAETFPGSGERVHRPDQRMLAAIVHTEAGPYYFKLLGSAQTVSHWLPAYESLLVSMRPAPASGPRNEDARHP